MLYWFDYWIETQIKTMDPSYAYTVAPDCVGAGPRCTFEELMLQYVFKLGKESERDRARNVC